MSDPKHPFAQLIGTITPIKKHDIAPEFGKRPKRAQRARIAAQNHRSSYPATPHQDTLNIDELSPMQIQHMREMRVPLAREIDLHGYYVDDAIRLLNDHLNERRNRRAEYWLLIHGKGKNSPHYDKAPLKIAVYDTLRQHHAVGAFAAVKDRDGESGAVVIRLRRSAKPHY